MNLSHSSLVIYIEYNYSKPVWHLSMLERPYRFLVIRCKHFRSLEASKMQELISIINNLGLKNEQLEIKFQGLNLEKQKLERQLGNSDKEKCELLEDIQKQKIKNKQTVESSVFLTEKNIKNFVRKTLSRFLKCWKKKSYGDEFEMTFELLARSLEFGSMDKEQLLMAFTD